MYKNSETISYNIVVAFSPRKLYHSNIYILNKEKIALQTNPNSGARTAPKEKRKFKISGTVIFNILVAIISVYLVINFIVSEDGLIDLLKSPDAFHWGWVVVGLLVFDCNMIIDAIVTQIYLRAEYPHFRFLDSFKVAFVGVFFGAVTPSNTGGQPMQLYFLSRKNVRIGYGSACMTQKFIVYQLVTTGFSIFAVIFKFDYFRTAFTNFWSSAFIVIGFVVQLAVTAMFLIVCFAENITRKLIRLIYKIMVAVKFVKEPRRKIMTIAREFKMFHSANRMLMGNKKRLVKIFLLVMVQICCIMSVPYFIYIAFDMPVIAAAHGAPVGNPFDFLCIQSFVLFTSNLVPLPGASGGAELAFSMYFGSYFVIANISKIKPAILLWRFITYYGAMLLTAPFSYYTKGRKRGDLTEEIEAEATAEGVVTEYE